jgi:hypothetical protein
MRRQISNNSTVTMECFAQTVFRLIFSLHYYSFDFTKSIFGLLFVAVSLMGWKLSSQVLNLFYPLAFDDERVAPQMFR